MSKIEASEHYQIAQEFEQRRVAQLKSLRNLCSPNRESDTRK